MSKPTHRITISSTDKGDTFFDVPEQFIEGAIVGYPNAIVETIEDAKARFLAKQRAGLKEMFPDDRKVQAPEPVWHPASELPKASKTVLMVAAGHFFLGYYSLSDADYLEIMPDDLEDSPAVPDMWAEIPVLPKDYPY